MRLFQNREVKMSKTSMDFDNPRALIDTLSLLSCLDMTEGSSKF